MALRRGWRWLDYVAKPGVMVVLLVWLWQNQALDGFGTLILFSLGVLFSLIGDVLLMLPNERFVGGLFAFLFAHLAYTAAFNINPPPLHVISAGLALIILAGGIWLFLQIRAGLIRSGKGKLVIPVLIYSGVIAVMLISALITPLRNGWGWEAASLVAVGALSFTLSDVLLAWDRFVTPFSWSWVRRILYHLGQITLVAGGIAKFLV
jgi:uncharacterized membrane protein YhhN